MVFIQFADGQFLGELTGTSWVKFLKAVAGNLVTQTEDQSQFSCVPINLLTFKANGPTHICHLIGIFSPLIVAFVLLWTFTDRFDIANETFLTADNSFPFLIGVAQGPVLIKYDITVTSLFLTSGKYFQFGTLVGE